MSIGTVHRQLRRVAGRAGCVRSDASVRARVTRAGRVDGQQAVPFRRGYGYPVTLVDGHFVQRPADLERGVPVDHGADGRHGVAPVHGPVGHFERGYARRYCRRDKNAAANWSDAASRGPLRVGTGPLDGDARNPRNPPPSGRANRKACHAVQHDRPTS